MKSKDFIQEASRSRVHFLKCFLSFPLLTAILYSIFLLVLTKFMKATKLRSDSLKFTSVNVKLQAKKKIRNAVIMF